MYIYVHTHTHLPCPAFLLPPLLAQICFSGAMTYHTKQWALYATKRLCSGDAVGVSSVTGRLNPLR